MNRPLWLDFVYLTSHGVPGALAAFFPSRYLLRLFDWPRWSFIFLFIPLFLLFTAAWIFIVSSWQKRWNGRKQP